MKINITPKRVRQIGLFVSVILFGAGFDIGLAIPGVTGFVGVLYFGITLIIVAVDEEADK